MPNDHIPGARDANHREEEEVEEAVDDTLLLPNLFQEPDGYFQLPDPARWVTHTLLSGRELRLRVVGSNALWAHYIWNAALALSLYLQQASPRPHVQPGQSTVLELGAAAGLPSLTAAILGARTVVATDYPDETILDNLRTNVRENACLLPRGSRDASVRDFQETSSVVVEPHLWGSDASPLLAHLHHTPVSSVADPQATPSHTVAQDGFSLVLMADVLYTPHSHRPLLASLRQTLSRTDKNAKALVFSCPYRPWLWDRDLEFFRLCESSDLDLATGQIPSEMAGEGGEPSPGKQPDDKVGETLCVTPLGRMPGGRVMFPNDPGFAPGPEGEQARTEVWGWEIRWRHSSSPTSTE